MVNRYIQMQTTTEVCLFSEKKLLSKYNLSAKN